MRRISVLFRAILAIGLPSFVYSQRYQSLSKGVGKGCRIKPKSNTRDTKYDGRKGRTAAIDSNDFDPTDCIQKQNAVEIEVQCLPGGAPFVFQVQHLLDEEEDGYLGKSRRKGFHGMQKSVEDSSIFNGGEINFVTVKNLFSGLSRISGSAQVNGTIYQFGTDETGNILCTETLLQDLPPDRLDDNFQLKDALEDHRVSKDSQSSSSSDNNSTNFLRKHRLPNRRLQVGVSKLVPYIDVLVPYTRRVLCAINNDETNPLGCSVTDARKEVVLDMIQLAIFESNVAFENSGIPGRFRLKHAFLLENTPFDEQTLTWDRTLRALTRFDGVLDEIYSVRSQYDADVVSLIVDKPDSCGLSYTGFPVNKQWAFSVVNYICATGYYSFVHEIMHNLGLNHDRNTQKCKPDGTCCGENACYNFGWQDPQARFRSIGAYNCPNGYCPRVQYFSQPELSYPHIESNGQKNMIRIGNSWNNNARMIRESWSDVANFYGSSSCGNGLCEPQSGENCRTCREDCIGGYQSVTGDCGNQICEAGENCQTCPADCPGRIVDDENISYCCVGGPYEDLAKMQIKYAKPCDWNYCRWNAECDISPVKTGNYCCGNGICEPGETVDICPDCKCSEDGFCDTSFETNSCQDCPAPVVGVSACMVTGRNCANIFPDPCCKGCNGILCR